jgi:hypothetical protein
MTVNVIGSYTFSVFAESAFDPVPGCAEVPSLDPVQPEETITAAAMNKLAPALNILLLNVFSLNMAFFPPYLMSGFSRVTPYK